jgi:hypothetical protein
MTDSAEESVSVHCESLGCDEHILDYNIFVTLITCDRTHLNKKWGANDSLAFWAFHL